MDIILAAENSALKSAPGHDGGAVGTVLIDAAGSIEFMDAGAERLFGYAAKELIGKPLSILIPASPVPGPEIFHNHATARRVQLSGRKKSGASFDFGLAFTALQLGTWRGWAGAISGPAVASQVATDFPHALAPEHRQVLLAALIASSTDAIMSKTVDGIVTSWNPAAQGMFGYTEREMIGQPMLRLLPPERAEEETAILEKIRRGECVDHFETIRQRKNGERFPVSVTISPIVDASGVIIGASKIARDISERRGMELELRQHRVHLEQLVASATAEMNAIVQTAVSGIVTTDVAGTIRQFNPAAEALFGWSRQEAIGSNITLLMAQDQAQGHRQQLADFARTGHSWVIGREREITALRKDGSAFPAHLAIGHTLLPGGSDFFVAFISDISAQKQVEQRLLRAKDEAESGARAKAAFFANMSHEIRTPMNAIIGFTDAVLQDPQLSHASAEHIRIVRHSAKALMSIINDILDISKLESGKFSLEEVAFHLPNALADAIELVGHEASDKGLRIVLDYHADLPLRVIGDPTRLRQVLLNLIGNAIKFTDQGRIDVVVRPELASDLLHFSVADTGIGMTPAQMDKVFASFSQGDTSTTRRYGGTGMGTAISRQITEMMGGKIWLESVLGRGSVFYFTARLPQSRQDSGCLYDDDSGVSDDYRSPRAFDVLLVEDLEVNAMLASYRLEQQGHRVEWRKNGEEAVAAFSAAKYDLILMDVMMPVMDGREATRIIRAREDPGRRRVPILALTASVMREEFEQCLAAGMDRVHGKPIDFSELFISMEQIVPAGKGRRIAAPQLAVAQAAVVDFSPLDGIADYRRALHLWHDPKNYLDALRAFAHDHVDDGEAIQRLLSAHPGTPEPARTLAHALTGVAANLLLLDVAEQAGRIGADLTARELVAAASGLLLLRALLAQVKVAIGNIAASTEADDAPLLPCAPGLAQALFGRLTGALSTLNPDAVEPVLLGLSAYVGRIELAPLRKAVDAFDFERAQTCAGELLCRLMVDRSLGPCP